MCAGVEMALLSYLVYEIPKSYLNSAVSVEDNNIFLFS